MEHLDTWVLEPVLTHARHYAWHRIGPLPSRIAGSGQSGRTQTQASFTQGRVSERGGGGKEEGAVKWDGDLEGL